MTQVIIQPAAGRKARANYARTIDQRVPLSDLRSYLTEEDCQRLVEACGREDVLVWAVKRTGYSRWNRIQPGDMVLFHRDKRIISAASVTYTCHSPALATNLWGEDETDGAVWEYVYFLDNLHEEDIALEDFNRVVGYELNAAHQGFNVLNQVKSDLALAEYDFNGFNTRLEHLVDAIDVEPDNPRLANVRGEQAELRRRLLRGRSVAPCSICGVDLPENLLVAAHIKKRSECSRDEKLDPQIVSLMCKLGCDALYENRYISVSSRTQSGVVVTSHRVSDSQEITFLLGRLDGREVIDWNVNKSKYFDWHYAEFLRNN